MATVVAASPQPTSSVLSRVSGYSLVSTSLAVYNYAKENSPQVIKTGVFQRAENVVSAVAHQPLVLKAAESVKLEERGAQLLDKFDSAVSKVNDLNRQRVELQTNVVSTVARAVHQPLDVALEVVDKYLPEAKADSTDDAAGVISLAKVAADAEATDATKVTSAAKLSKLTAKLQQAAFSKLTSLKLRSEEQLASMQFAVNLIDYAKQHNLVDYAKQHVDIKTVAHVQDVVVSTVEKATEIAQSTVAKAQAIVSKTSEAVQAVTKVAKEKTAVAKESVNHLALKLQETQWKQQFDQIMGPYLLAAKSQSEKITIVTVSTLAVVVDFTLQQFKLTKQREFTQVLANVSKVAKQVVDASVNLSVDTVQQLEKVLDSVQQTLRSAIEQASNMSFLSSIQFVGELHTRITAALKLIAPLALTSTA